MLLDEEIGQLSVAPGAPPVSAPDNFQSKSGQSAGSVKAMEQQLIQETLKQTNNNRTMAAKLLGISVRTLRNKLKLYREQDYQAVA